MEISSILSYADEHDSDVIAYVGKVSRTGYDKLCKEIPKKPRKNCLFVLATLGGDGNAGYRIARALSHYYPEPGQIKILVPHYCKSAGTLICIGAHELIVADCGELGPLDIQVQKPDEMMQLASGLDIIRGLTYLRDESLTTFREYLIDINDGSGLSTTIASDMASKLTIGMFTPIVAQIDPMRLGEMQAALTVAVEYGARLNERTQNLKPNALQRLSMQYPSHGFVIDRKEVRDLFKTVRRPEAGVEQELCEVFASAFERQRHDRVIVVNLLASEPEESSKSGVSEGDANAEQVEGIEAKPTNASGTESDDGLAERGDKANSGSDQGQPPSVAGDGAVPKSPGAPH